MSSVAFRPSNPGTGMQIIQSLAETQHTAWTALRFNPFYLPDHSSSSPARKNPPCSSHESSSRSVIRRRVVQDTSASSCERLSDPLLRVLKKVMTKGTSIRAVQSPCSSVENDQRPLQHCRFVVVLSEEISLCCDTRPHLISGDSEQTLGKLFEEEALDHAYPVG